MDRDSSTFIHLLTVLILHRQWSCASVFLKSLNFYISLLCYRADEEVVDPKKYYEDTCKPKCVRPLRAYQVISEMWSLHSLLPCPICKGAPSRILKHLIFIFSIVLHYTLACRSFFFLKKKKLEEKNTILSFSSEWQSPEPMCMSMCEWSYVKFYCNS